MKTWLITGTSTGLGRTLTEKLLAKGDRVVATVRKADALDELKRTFPENLWVFVLDVTDTEAIKNVISKAFNDLGQIDVVVSNAG